MPNYYEWRGFSVRVDANGEIFVCDSHGDEVIMCDDDWDDMFLELGWLDGNPPCVD